MHPRIFISFLILFSCMFSPNWRSTAYADSIPSIKQLIKLSDQIIESSEKNNSQETSTAFEKLKSDWFQLKPIIRKDSYMVSSQLESSIASATHDRLNEDDKSFYFIDSYL